MSEHYPADPHPDPQLLERFMRNEAGPPERRVVVLHLLTGCAQCVAVTRRLWSLGEVPPGAVAQEGEVDAVYGRMLDEVARRGARRQRRAKAEREAAPRRLAKLRQLAAAQRRPKGAGAPGFSKPPASALLIG